MSSSTNNTTTLLATAAITLPITAYITFRTSRALLNPRPNLPQLYSVPDDETNTNNNSSVINASTPRIHPSLITNEFQLIQSQLPLIAAKLTPDNITMWNIFNSTATQFPDKPCHGTLTKDFTGFTWQTYGQVCQDMIALGRGMTALGLFTSIGKDKYPYVSMNVCGLFGINSSDWVKAEYGIVSQGGTTVTLYSTLTGDGIAHVVNMTTIQTVVCLSKDIAKRCIEVKPKCPSIKTIVVPTPEIMTDEEVLNLAKQHNIKLLSFDDLKQAGRTSTNSSPPPTSKTPYTFCFTSGSTGGPKGSILTHENMVLNIAMTNFVLQNPRNEQDRKGMCDYYLSFLPLAHQMERMLQSVIYANVGAVGFSRGIPEKIMDDVAILRPTMFGCVPRLLNRLALGIQTQANKAGGLKTALFNYALESKLHDLTEYGTFTHPIWDRIVFNKIRVKMGLDRCKTCLTGSAPIPPRTLDFLRVVFCMPVTEGWGQTELTCTGSSTYPYHVGGPTERPSHIGGPVPCLKIRLIESSIYKPTDRLHGKIPVLGRGEILVKGKNVMMGYYGMEEKSKETIDSDGWLHTGDIACLNIDGTYSIVDRASNVFKLQQGEFVEPDKIERGILRCQLISQCFVFGTTLNSKLVVIAVPNPDAFGPFLQNKGLNPATDKDKINETVLDEVKKCCKEAQLLGFEIPAAITMVDKPFSVDNGVMTATFKIVRHVAKVVYREEIIKMYKGLGEECKI
jgi:long-chain acyl-CoA synthetase